MTALGSPELLLSMCPPFFLLLIMGTITLTTGLCRAPSQTAAHTSFYPRMGHGYSLCLFIICTFFIIHHK